MKKRVFLGLSGGVDSAVAAKLLMDQGYEVTGVFMKNWSGDNYGIQDNCPWEEDQADAMAVCEHLGIEFRSVNFEKEYRERVVEYFFNEYKKGRTPNPDVMCNKEIKFKLFLDKAMEMGYDYIATGHYAIRKDDKLFRSIDKNKDQTYFIYNLTPEQLSKSLFPIGEYTKPQIRELAKEFNLPNAAKPDSQGICFIGEINVMKFLMSQIPEQTGEIRDIDTNEVVGDHKGIYFYTIGQRDGLGIGGLSVPYFVVDKDVEKNILYVASGTDHKSLYKTEVELENIHYINPEEFKDAEVIENIEASVRYRQKPIKGKLLIKELKFIFEEPVRAVASGQSLVIFKEDWVIGGGVIK
jgi:tRNA-specific 2-thiouridylase